MLDDITYGPTSFTWPCLPRTAFGPPSNSPFASTVPATAILTEAGDPLLTEAGDYLLTEA